MNEPRPHIARRGFQRNVLPFSASRTSPASHFHAQTVQTSSGIARDRTDNSQDREYETMECSSESDFNSLRDCIQDIDGQTNIDETRKMVSMDVLLDSGVLTDVKVSCGDRSWDLHKLILCSRCSFFKKALTGEFQVRPARQPVCSIFTRDSFPLTSTQEAKTGHVILRENDPDDIDGIITYIYTGRGKYEFLILLPI